ncbi:MAG: hypothetical protein J2P17_21745 [Mycobacterium sp.]|nr:hypothetical protein [Mycobacterium sp.]
MGIEMKGEGDMDRSPGWEYFLPWWRRKAVYHSGLAPDRCRELLEAAAPTLLFDTIRHKGIYRTPLSRGDLTLVRKGPFTRFAKPAARVRLRPTADGAEVEVSVGHSVSSFLLLFILADGAVNWLAGTFDPVMRVLFIFVAMLGLLWFALGRRDAPLLAQFVRTQLAIQ